MTVRIRQNRRPTMLKRINNNKWIKLPLGDILSNYLPIFQATLSPFCQSEVHISSNLHLCCLSLYPYSSRQRNSTPSNFRIRGTIQSRNLMNKLSDTQKDSPAVFIFIHPPSFCLLWKRWLFQWRFFFSSTNVSSIGIILAFHWRLSFWNSLNYPAFQTETQSHICT